MKGLLREMNETPDSSLYQDSSKSCASNAPRKRKTSDLNQHSERLIKRNRSQSGRRRLNRDYVELLNGVIRDACDRRSHGLEMTGKRRRPLQVGMTAWTEEEQENFFDQLALTGLNDRDALVNSVPSKTPLEILEFERRLAEASVEHKLHGRRFTLLRPEEIPAAAEVSTACCQQLEHAADDVLQMELAEDSRNAEGRHDERWLLTQEVAEELKHAAHASGDYPPDHAGSEPDYVPPRVDLSDAVDFLNLGNFLQLSSHLFMSADASGPVSGAPLSIRMETDDPGIFATAFTDFHNLAVSVTRRLVSASLSQANSRLRAKDRGEKQNLSVKEHDVTSAIDVLRMPRDSVDYWRGAPRRLDLSVYRTLTTEKAKQRQYLTHEKVERLLSGSDTTVDGRNADSVGPAEPLTEDDDLSEMDDNSTASQDSEDTDLEPGDAGQEAYLRAYDRRISAEQEIQLWKMFEMSPPAEIAETLDAELPDPPKFVRKTTEELADWRNRCDYKSPWERYGFDPDMKVLPPSRLRSRRAKSRSTSSKRRKIKDVEVGDSNSDAQAGAADYPAMPPARSAVRETTPSKIAESDMDAASDSSSEAAPSGAHSSPPRGRPRRRSATPVSYRAEPEDGVPRPEDLPSDSEDDYEPTK